MAELINLADITVAIPAKNEAGNLLRCLNSIGKNFAREIVLIDSSSCDGSVEIARGWGATVLNFQWNGRFPKKRNWFLRSHRPLTRWVLFLDADEYLTEEFKDEVRRALASGEYVGFWLSYSVYFLGRQLKGGYSLRKLALFRVDAGEYERIDEQTWSHLDMEVHEHPVIEGKIGIIKSQIDHQDFRGMSHYISKHNEYSSWEAARFLDRMRNAAEDEKWTWKQRLKYRLLQSPFIGPMYFLGSFFLMGGWRDGTRGLAFGILKMAYFTQVYCKIVEINSGLKFAGRAGDKKG